MVTSAAGYVIQLLVGKFSCLKHLLIICLSAFFGEFDTVFFGKIDKLSLFSDTVAVLTAEPMREDVAASILAKLNCGKAYRLL